MNEDDIIELRRFNDTLADDYYGEITTLYWDQYIHGNHHAALSAGSNADYTGSWHWDDERWEFV